MWVHYWLGWARLGRGHGHDCGIAGQMNMAQTRKTRSQASGCIHGQMGRTADGMPIAGNTNSSEAGVAAGWDQWRR